MTEKAKKIIKKKQEVKHNQELGNNYYPSGWKPRIDYDYGTNTGELTHVQPHDDNFKFNSLLESWGYDSKEFYIEEDRIRFSTWQTQIKGGEIVDMYAFKAIIKKRNPHHNKFFRKLERQIEKKKPIKVSQDTGELAYMFFCADWQFGKEEYGADWGVDSTIDYIRNAIVKAKREIKNLKKIGQVVDEIYIIGLGDLIECTFGFFDHQNFNISLTRTEQEHLARKMVLEVLDGLLGLAPKIVIGAVIGNHSEYRTGKTTVATTRLDGSDTAIFQIVGEIIEGRERYKHVKTVVPDDYHLTLEIKGKRITFYHGHMVSGGSGIEGRLMNWWKNQGHAGRIQSDYLVTGHYHHLRVLTERGKTWFQAPSLDTSVELEARSGLTTSHGVLTFTLSKDGWDNLKIL